MKRPKLRALIPVAGLLVCGAAKAGVFNALFFSTIKSEPALIANGLSERITTRYPASQFTFIVISGYQRHADGRGVAFATVGVSPTVGSNLGAVPNRRFQATSISDPSLNMSAAYAERDAIRLAFEAMRAQCDQTPSCDLEH